jgi:hypothetical protein
VDELLIGDLGLCKRTCATPGSDDQYLLPICMIQGPDAFSGGTLDGQVVNPFLTAICENYIDRPAGRR